MCSVLKAGYASAPVFEISLSLTNTLKSLHFASMSSTSFPYGGEFKNVPWFEFLKQCNSALESGMLDISLLNFSNGRLMGMCSSTEHLGPTVHLIISKQSEEARISDGDILQQSPQGDD
ncbi:MAG: hypothetical protein EZS28_042869, partial [Streblomastix strix]